MQVNEAKSTFTLGLIINPYAGIGGALALKGSDGKDIREKALSAGASLQAISRARTALEVLIPLKDKFRVITCSGDMGERLCQDLAFDYHVVYSQKLQQSEASDTINAAQAISTYGVDLMLFAGGDGTARNLCNVFPVSQALLGIPAGCKIHSGVYAITPNAAGKVAAQMVRGELVSVMQAEVRDIDEDKFRQGLVVAKYFGEMAVPESLTYIQAVKMGGKESDELVLADISAYIRELMEELPDHYFIIGSGSTVDFVMSDMHLSNTLLGVDVVYEGNVVAQDVTAAELQNLTSTKSIKLLITAIGGQGHLFGRGNQQLSEQVLASIEKSDIWVVCTKSKLLNLKNAGFIADTGNHALDNRLAGPIQVITGYKDKALYFIRRT